MRLDLDDEEGALGPPIYAGRSTRCLDCREPLSIEEQRKGYDLCEACDDSGAEAWDESINLEPIDAEEA